MVELLYLLHLLSVETFLEAREQSVVSYLSCVRYEREHGVVDVAIYGIEHLWHEQFAEAFALAVDVAVGTATEVYAFERASRIAALFEYALHAHLSAAVHEQRIAGLQLFDIVAFEVERRLQHRAFGCYGYELVVLVVERWSYSPRVAHREHLARPSESAHHVATVKVGHCGAQHVRHIHMVVDIARYVHAFESELLGINKVAFGFAVEAVAHQFEQSVTIAIDAREHTLREHLLEYLVDISHIEVAADAEVLSLPVVAAQERVYVCESFLSGRGVAQVSHVELSGEGQMVLCKLGIGEQFGRESGVLFLHASKYLGNGILAFGTLTEYVFCSGHSVEFYTCHSGTFLSAIVLFLHHQIELVECEHPRAVLLLIVFERLEQSYHCHTAFMFQRFHDTSIMCLNVFRLKIITV